jgi:hypothetical protein
VICLPASSFGPEYSMSPLQDVTKGCRGLGETSINEGHPFGKHPFKHDL